MKLTDKFIQQEIDNGEFTMYKWSTVVENEVMKVKRTKLG